MIHDENNFVSNREIGKRIKHRRRELSVTQEELAVVLGVSYQQIQRYESGMNSLNAEKLQVVAKALSVPVSYLLCPGRYDGSPLEDHGERTLICCYRRVQHPTTKALLIQVTDLLVKWEENIGGC